jgi:hypothetical protein
MYLPNSYTYLHQSYYILVYTLIQLYIHILLLKLQLQLILL